MASKNLALRTAIKDSVVAADIGLAESRVVVERQHDIMSKIDAATAKIGAVALTILPTEGKHLNPESKTIFLDTKVTLTLWCKPILVDTAAHRASETFKPEEEIWEALIQHLHHRTFAAVHDAAGLQRQRMEFVSWRDVADVQYLRRESTFQTRLWIDPA